MKTSKKLAHVHIGPHKTGSSAIQSALPQLAGFLRKELNVVQIHERKILDAAKQLNKDNYPQAIKLLRNCIEANCTGDESILISCEDFSGHLPGRNAAKSPYQRLLINIKAITKALENYDCLFYFFHREPNAWLKSAYVQNLKHRQKFCSFEEFTNFLRVENLWSEVLNEAADELGANLKVIHYSEEPGFSSMEALVSAIDPQAALKMPSIGSERLNQSPPDSVVSILEKINGSSASNRAKRNAKEKVLGSSTIKPRTPRNFSFPSWGADQRQKPKWLNEELEPLWNRVEHRVHNQVQPNLMPNLLVDLNEYRMRLVEASEIFPEGGREDLKNQSQILKYRFRGHPMTCYLLGLSISYLRRDTAHTEHAAILFQRLWQEEHDVLLGTLPTRWLISAFQTFMEHGANENQRLIGAGAYFFSNILKAYEAERALDGLPADSVYPNVSPVTPNKFPGLDRFKLGGSDLLLNTNALLLEIAARDACAGRVVQEFFLRLKKANSIFSRMDSSRIHHDVNIRQFQNCWSFFIKP